VAASLQKEHSGGDRVATQTQNCCEGGLANRGSPRRDQTRKRNPFRPPRSCPRHPKSRLDRCKQRPPGPLPDRVLRQDGDTAAQSPNVAAPNPKRPRCRRRHRCRGLLLPGQRQSRRRRWLRMHGPTRTQVSAPSTTSVSHLANCRTARPPRNVLLSIPPRTGPRLPQSTPGGSSLGRDWAVRPPRPATHTSETRIYRAFLPSAPWRAHVFPWSEPVTPTCGEQPRNCRHFIC
jgi:hypothetical protein